MESCLAKSRHVAVGRRYMANLVIISALLNGSLWPSTGTELQPKSPGIKPSSSSVIRINRASGLVECYQVALSSRGPRREEAATEDDWRSAGRTARANVTDDALASFGLGRLPLLPGSWSSARLLAMSVGSVVAPSRLRTRLRHVAVGRYLHLRFHCPFHD